MEQGEKIASLRKKQGMTQAELGDKLNITYQAVSKWERGESYPNFDTLSQIAKLFGVPISYFEKDYSEEDPAAEAAAESTVATAAAQEQIEREMLGVCKSCGNVVYKGDEAQTMPHLLCKPCKARQDAEKKRRDMEEQRRTEALKQSKLYERNAAIAATKRKRNIGFIVAALVTAFFLVIGIVSSVKSANTAESLGGTLVLCIFSFTFTSQMIWGGVVRNVCCEGGVLIGTPGVIFTLDLDGVISL